MIKVVPLVPSPAWPTTKQLTRLERELDALTRFDKLLMAMHDGMSPIDESVIAAYEKSEVRAMLINGELGKLVAACTTDIEAVWWDLDKGEVRASEVAKFISRFIGSFATGPQNPEAFMRQMIEDVYSWDPHFVPLSWACAELRMTEKKVPTIAKLHEVYEAASMKLAEAWDALDGVEWAYEQLTATPRAD
jgi:hypothetical protein